MHRKHTGSTHHRRRLLSLASGPALAKHAFSGRSLALGCRLSWEGTETRRTPGSHIRWKPGESGNPNGKPYGTRDRLTTQFIQKLSADFHDHGVAAIEKVRRDDPTAYLRLVASLVPKEVRLSQDNPLDQYSDDEVAALLTAAAGLVEDEGQQEDQDPSSTMH